MAKFLYSVTLPVSRQTVLLTELPFTELKNIVKNIANANNDIILTAFNDILHEHCKEDVSKLTIIDKLYILLTIRAVCISPILELMVTCPITDQQFNSTVNVDDILTILKSKHIELQTVTYQNNLKITYGLPTSLYINRDMLDATEAVINCISLNDCSFYDITAEMVNKLPAVVLNDIQTYANMIYNHLHSLELLNLPSPYDDTNDNNIILTANVFDNSVIEFLKLCFNRDLMSFYKIEYFLMNQFRMTHETLSKLTLAEVNVYMALYKEEQAEREKAEKKAASSQATPTPLIGS